MGAAIGRFAGKAAFGSTGAGGNAAYLTTWTREQGASAGTVPRLPAMKAPAVTDQERCLLYAQHDGSLRIQLGGLLWVALNLELGWLVLTGDPTQAAAFVLSGDPPGQCWQVQTASGLAPVAYSGNALSPILSINGGPGTQDRFAPLAVTPSLDRIRQAKACPGGDLRHVDLRGQDLSGVDFTGADFSAANLDGARFTGSGSILTRAVFRDAVLTGIRCDGAALDGADFSGANLDGVAWGSPASAKGVVLSGCSARGAVLGGQAIPLDCSGANLASGDFRGADLRGLRLGGAKAGGAILAVCRLDQAVLDHADLREAVALGASLRGASLRGVDAQGASFVRADLSGADLTRAKMGARAYLFTLAGTFAAELDQRPYPQPDLLQAFQAQGSPIAPGAPVAVLAQGKRWQIRDDGGPYLLLLGAVGIDVFWAAADLRPAVLRDATCQGTTAPGASLSGADLRGVRSPEAQEALAWICRVYWYPLYAYIRRRGHAADEARDLTEEFFVRLLEKGFLRTADRDKGRFRAFLLACCKHFLANQRDRDRAAKRGGGRIPLSIDPSAAEPRC